MSRILRWVVGLGPVLGAAGHSLYVENGVSLDQLFTPENMLVTAECAVDAGISLKEIREASGWGAAPVKDPCVSIDRIWIGDVCILNERRKSQDLWLLTDLPKKVLLDPALTIRVKVLFHRRAIWSASVLGTHEVCAGPEELLRRRKELGLA